MYRYLPPPNKIQESADCKMPKPHKKASFDFKQIKKNTIKSLNEVEYFLNNFNRALTCIKLYKIFK